MPDNMKLCKSCQTRKPLSSFRRDEKCSDGRRNRCNACSRGKKRAKVSASALAVKTDKKTVVFRKLVLLPDVHVPDQDVLCWSAVMKFIDDSKPDEVGVMGDFLELESCSMHEGSAHLVQLESDFQAGYRALKGIRELIPNGDMFYLEGNHETRLKRFIAVNAPSLDGALSIPQGLRLDDLGIKWYPEDQQPIFRGKLGILHGHQISRALPMHHAARAAQLYGERGHIIVYGHTHKEQVFSAAQHNGNRKAVGLGALRSLKVPWMHGAVTGWVNQFAIAYIRVDTGAASLFPVTVDNGSFIWADKLYVGSR